ncbi:MAG: hypothetical protein HY047_07310 [Acidobacteria bacterium]|nr:hypothetical protein [Acidobacteriota bacterium]
MRIKRSTRAAVFLLLGESLREIAVLVAVFAPLDAFAQGRTLTTRFLATTIVGVVALLGFGIYLEVKWRWKD